MSRERVDSLLCLRLCVEGEGGANCSWQGILDFDDFMQSTGCAVHGRVGEKIGAGGHT